MNFISRFVARCGAEIALERVRLYEPERWERIRQYVGQHGYPQLEPGDEDGKILWDVYRKEYGIEQKSG